MDKYKVYEGFFVLKDLYYSLNEKLNSINPEVSLVCKINFFYLALTKA